MSGKYQGELTEIQAMVKEIEGQKVVDDDYYHAILQIAEFCEKNSSACRELELSDKMIFLSERRGKLYFSCACALYVGSDLGGNDLIGEFYRDRFKIYAGYRENLNENDISVLSRLFVKCGAVDKIEIEEVRSAARAVSHPLYYSELNPYERTRTENEYYLDYQIPNIDIILRQYSLDLNKMIFDLIKRRSDIALPFASYQPNYAAGTRKCEASFIYYLKRRKWIPDCKGEFHTPDDIDDDQIHPDFLCDNNNQIFKLIGYREEFFKRKERCKKILDILSDCNKDEAILTIGLVAKEYIKMWH